MRLIARVVFLAAMLSPAFAQQNWRWPNSLPAPSDWTDLAFGNSTYVAVGLDASIATSADGNDSVRTTGVNSTAGVALVEVYELP